MKYWMSICDRARAVNLQVFMLCPFVLVFFLGDFVPGSDGDVYGVEDEEC